MQLKARRITQSKHAVFGGVILNDDKKESLWIPCPLCGAKTKTKVYQDTILVKFPLYCPKCKKETRIDIVQLKMVLSK